VGYRDEPLRAAKDEVTGPGSATFFFKGPCSRSRVAVTIYCENATAKPGAPGQWALAAYMGRDRRA